MTILNCLQSWTTRTQKYLFIIWNEWHLMTSKKCRRKVINDRDMETPYLLIKGFYQWRNYFYLYGWNDFEMCMAVEYIVWVKLVETVSPRQLVCQSSAVWLSRRDSFNNYSYKNFVERCLLIGESILHFRPHTAREPHSASCCLSINYVVFVRCSVYFYFSFIQVENICL